MDVVAILKQLCIDLILNPQNADISVCFDSIEVIKAEYELRLNQVADQYGAVTPKYFKEEYWHKLDRTHDN